jgi:hypothetical protein
MSDYLANLAARALNSAEVLQPRLPSRFGPAPGAGGLGLDTLESEEAQEQGAPGVPVPAPPPELPQRAADLRLPLDLPRPGDPASGRRVTGQAALLAPAPDGPAAVPAVPAAPEGSGREPYRGAMGEPGDVPSPTLPEGQDRAPAPSPASTGQTAITIVAHAVPRRTPEEPAAPGEASASEPVIRVTIGRIDVRAVMPFPAPAPRPAAPAAPPPSLEEYLRKRSRGER